MSTIKLAIQKSGRLNEDSLSLLQSCGITIKNGNDQLKTKATNFPIELFYLRNSDIPKYLEGGIVDLAIIGENTLLEKQKQHKQILKLGFSKCNVSLAIPKSELYTGLSYFTNKKIATSYPYTLQSFLEEHNIDAEIHLITGSVEIAPSIGLADAVCDIVSSGSTLFKNGLKEVEQVLSSEACLAATMELSLEKQAILDQLVFRMNAVLRAKTSKYILMNVPNENISQVSSILPVLKSATVLPLSIPGWSSLHSVIEENKFWQVIDQLKKAGAEDILIVPIEKMVL
jgi:ATP phosphoribosyltransferase